MESSKSARTMSGGPFVLETGGTWMPLLPADNLDMHMMVCTRILLDYISLDFTIIFMCMHAQEAILKAHLHQRLYQSTLFTITAMGERAICKTVKCRRCPAALLALPLYVCEEMF